MLKVPARKKSKKKLLPDNPKIMDFFGKGKGIFGDGLKYQKRIRKWK